MYRVVWKQFALDAATSDVRGRWVLLADQGGVATALQRALEERGASCVLVGREDAEAHVAAALESEEPTRGVLCAFGLDEGGETPTLAALKVLARASGPRCWLLTRGAVAVDPGDRVDASQGAYSGLARSFSLECPRAWGGQVDLPPPGAEDDGLNGLVLLLGGASGEDHVALRAGGAFGARLVRREPPPPAARARLELSGTVLVTGGLGGLGRELARWLALRGARSLLLTGRRGIETPRAKGLVEELEARGVRVAVARADSSDGAAMRAALLDVPPDRPLCAVFHLAGVEDATPIAELTPARLREVLAPKRDGAEVLRELTNDVPLEAFVCFSSIAGVWGAGRQAAYAAANSYLDVWAHAERARGRRALAISWGPWLGEGMASPEALSQLEKRGVRGLDRRLALEALDAALHADEPHVVVADVDWALFRRAYEAWRPRPLLDELEAPTPAAERVTGVERGAFARELGALPTAMRAERLQRWVTDQCAHVLGHTAAVAIDPRRGFSDLGMDSLMAVELRSRVEQGLGVKIPATVTFDHPSVVALCNYLLDPLGLSPTPRTRAEEASPRAPDPRLEDLDDESLLAVLDEELSLAKRGNAR